MNMIYFYWYEFSKIYARLMRLEIQIKRNIVFAVQKNYGNNSYNRFICFFQDNKKRRKRYTLSMGNIHKIKLYDYSTYMLY